MQLGESSNHHRGVSKIRAKVVHYRRVYDDLKAIASKLEPYLLEKNAFKALTDIEFAPYPIP